jgi:hypothetical protein
MLGLRAPEKKSPNFLENRGPENGGENISNGSDF